MIHKLMLILTVVSTATAFLPLPEPKDPIDCPNKYTYSFSRYSICLTKDKYAATDLESAQAYCKSISSSLCSLQQMGNAWTKGYYDPRWGMYNVQSRDARVTSCGNYKGAECWGTTVVIFVRTSLIPNTPRPSAMQPAYCCS